VVFQGLEEKYGLELDRNWTILKNKKSMGKVQSHYIRTKSKPVIMDMENGSKTTLIKEGKIDIGYNTHNIMKSLLPYNMINFQNLPRIIVVTYISV
jgi:hypothetical protein